MREAAEQAVARLHEHDIPVRPTATATFNADHAYGTADGALSAAFPDLGGTVTDAVEARRVLAASPAHRKPPPAVGAVVDRLAPEGRALGGEPGALVTAGDSGGGGLPHARRRPGPRLLPGEPHRLLPDRRAPAPVLAVPRPGR
ncbi:hypothetical protein [Streptomyces huasconensis]|uniref:hypothetical protein n=1 Tax=Streptomyces huasconensis TaxID=1854574 RepID=UPI0033F548E4